MLEHWPPMKPRAVRYDKALSTPPCALGATLSCYSSCMGGGLAIPKGLCPKAQGCSSSRNPGNESNGIINPNGVVASASSWRSRDARQFKEDKATTPLGLTNYRDRIPRVVEDSNPGLWGATPLGLSACSENGHPRWLADSHPWVLSRASVTLGFY